MDENICGSDTYKITETGRDVMKKKGEKAERLRLSFGFDFSASNHTCGNERQQKHTTATTTTSHLNPPLIFLVHLGHNNPSNHLRRTPKRRSRPPNRHNPTHHQQPHINPPTPPLQRNLRRHRSNNPQYKSGERTEDGHHRTEFGDKDGDANGEEDEGYAFEDEEGLFEGGVCLVMGCGRRSGMGLRGFGGGVGVGGTVCIVGGSGFKPEENFQGDIQLERGRDISVRRGEICFKKTKKGEAYRSSGKGEL